MNIHTLEDREIRLTKAMKRPKILAVLHQETSSAGRVGKLLNEMGYDIETCRPPLGQQLPETLEQYAGTVVFGGPMSANDKDEFVKREIDWIATPLKENKPFLGICLGAQMLSKQLGGSVKANDKEYAEIGYYPLEATEEGKILGHWPKMVYQWHREGFSLPSGAKLLATGVEYKNQAMQIGENVFGLQFHSEVTFAMMCKWTVKGAYRFSLKGAQQRKQHLDGWYQYDKATGIWLRQFLKNWIRPVA